VWQRWWKIFYQDFLSWRKNVFIFEKKNCSALADWADCVFGNTCVDTCVVFIVESVSFILDIHELSFFWRILFMFCLWCLRDLCNIEWEFWGWLCFQIVISFRVGWIFLPNLDRIFSKVSIFVVLTRTVLIFLELKQYNCKVPHGEY